jgi:hypothetical protein
MNANTKRTLWIFTLLIAFPVICLAQGGKTPVILVVGEVGATGGTPATAGAPGAVAGKPAATSVAPGALPSATGSYVRYPSMEPVTAIFVQMADPKTLDALTKAIGKDPHHPGWDCTQASSYNVSVVSKQPDGTFKHIRNEVIVSVALQGNDPDTGHRWTYCRPGFPGEVQLILKADVAPTETVQVSFVGIPDGTPMHSDGTLKLLSARKSSFLATPQAAPSESLTNGKKRDVGQVNATFSDSNLFSSLPFDSYVKSADLFSTDGKDSKSSFSGTFGIQRGILGMWYSPIHLEESVQGNQTATNLSTVTTLGVTTLLPWAWSGKLFNNPVFDAPLPPDITVDNQYTHRIRQNITVTNTKLLATNDYSLNPYASWSSIKLPWSCSILSLLNGIGKQAGKGKVAGQYCAGVEADLGMYYLPLDLTASKSRRAEGYGDASLLIPLTGLSFASKIFPYLTTDDPAKTQIRIKYADAVNASSNYVRSKQWTYGFEIIK